jgi:hypothetical protein
LRENAIQQTDIASPQILSCSAAKIKKPPNTQGLMQAVKKVKLNM